MLRYLGIQITRHWHAVRNMMEAFGQETPQKPVDEIDEETRLLRARLIMEEAMELIQEGLGVEIELLDNEAIDFEDMHFYIGDKQDVVKVIDGCADLSVVTTGTLIAYGIPDEPFLQEVDINNSEKALKGSRNEYGKFIKHPDHQPPNIEGVLETVKIRMDAVTNLHLESAE